MFFIHQRPLDLASVQSLEERRSHNFKYRASACMRWSWKATTTKRFAWDRDTSQAQQCQGDRAILPSLDTGTHSSDRCEEFESETKSRLSLPTAGFDIVCHPFASSVRTT